MQSGEGEGADLSFNLESLGLEDAT
jgi:hypothetical protein